MAGATDKFPTWPTDAIHAASVVAEEMGELQKGVVQMVYEPWKTGTLHVREEAIQLAAVALRFIMSLDEYEYLSCAQHKQSFVS